MNNQEHTLKHTGECKVRFHFVMKGCKSFQLKKKKKKSEGGESQSATESEESSVSVLESRPLLTG